MDVRRLGWLGTRTPRFAETTRFFRDVLGLTTFSEEPDFAMFALPGADHDYVEIIGPDAAEPEPPRPRLPRRVDRQCWLETAPEVEAWATTTLRDAVVVPPLSLAPVRPGPPHRGAPRSLAGYDPALPRRHLTEPSLGQAPPEP